MSNPNIINNLPLAHEMADAESPYRELALHAKALGLIAVSTEMAQRANDASDEIVRDDNYRENETEVSMEDKREQLLELLHSSGIVASTWTIGSEIPDTYGSTFGNGYQMLHGENLNSDDGRSLLSIKTHKDILEKIKANNVAEVLTFTNLENSKYYGAIPGHRGAVGSVVILSYETTIGQGYAGKQYQQGTAQVPGIQTKYHLFMEAKRAAELQESIANDPQIIHTLTDTMMRDVFGIKEETWKKLGPQYEAWKELNGGTNRIAIRNGMDIPAEQSKIIEFS